MSASSSRSSCPATRTARRCGCRLTQHFRWNITSASQPRRKMAIQKRSSEVWNRLAEVKTEFGKFGEALSAVKEKIDQASRKIEDVDVRSRAITKKLRDVDELPSNPQPLLRDLLPDEEEEGLGE